MNRHEYESMSQYLATHSPFYLLPQHGWKFRWLFLWLPFACFAWFLLVPDYRIGWAVVEAPPVGAVASYEMVSAQKQCDACQPAMGVLAFVMWAICAAVICVFAFVILDLLASARRVGGTALWRWLPILERGAFASSVLPMLITMDSAIGPPIFINHVSIATTLNVAMQFSMLTFVAAILVLSIFVDREIKKADFAAAGADDNL